MQRWKLGLEQTLARFSSFTYNYPVLVILVAFFTISVIAFKLSALQQESSMESFLDKDHKGWQAYQDFRHHFGRDEFIAITVETDNLYDPVFLAGLKAFHEDIELSVSYLQDVTSAANIRYIEGTEEGMVLEELLAFPPQTAEEMAAFKQKVETTPAYQRRLFSDDRSLTNMMVKLLPEYIMTDEYGNETIHYIGDEELKTVQEQLRQLREKHNGFAKKIWISGIPAVTEILSSSIQKDMQVLSTAAIVIIGLFLLFMFRRLSGLLLPMLLMTMTVMATMGLMGWLEYPLTITASILPSFILAVCVGDSVHMLSYFYRAYDLGASKKKALNEAMKHTGVAMLFTSLTTSAGLLSFAVSDVAPIASLGLFAAIGSMTAFILTISVLPAFLALVPIKQKIPQHEAEKNDALHKFLERVVDFVQTFPKSIVVISVLFFMAAIASAIQITFSHNGLKWFKPEMEIYQAVTLVDERMGGSMPLEVIVDTGIVGGAKDPEVIKAIDLWLNGLMNDNQYAVNAGSIDDIGRLLKETNKALNGNLDSAYVIPETRDAVAQEMLMIEMDQADELAKYVDNDYRILRATIFLPWLDALQYAALVKQLQSSFDRQVVSQLSQPIVGSVTGMSALLSEVFDAMITSTAISYALAAGVIFIMMMILLGHVGLGALSMFPNLLPIITMIGFMWWTGKSLDMFTMLIGSIAIGLSVDDTVHFMYTFRKNYAESGNADKAVRDTLLTVGRALIVTSLVLSLGFLSYTLSHLNNMDDFGILTAMCIMLALLADLILAPALMLWLYRGKDNRQLSALNNNDQVNVNSKGKKVVQQVEPL